MNALLTGMHETGMPSPASFREIASSVLDNPSYQTCSLVSPDEPYLFILAKYYANLTVTVNQYVAVKMYPSQTTLGFNLNGGTPESQEFWYAFSISAYQPDKVPPGYGGHVLASGNSTRQFSITPEHESWARCNVHRLSLTLYGAFPIGYPLSP